MRRVHFLASGLAGALLAGSVGARDLAYLLHADGFWQVAVLNLDTGETRQWSSSAGDKTRISWLPDGQRMLVSAADGRVFLLDAKGHEEVIPLFPSGTVDAVVSPDGQRLAYSLSTSSSIDDNNIWIADLNGQQLEKLTQMARLQHEPVWSPDGSALYFLSGDGGHSHDVWRIDVKTRAIAQITVDALYNFDVAARADGTIALSSNRAGHYDLWLLRPNGEAEALTNDPPLDARPSWASDGKTLAFESSRGGAMNVWLLDVESRVMRQLTHSQAGARHPAWRPEVAR